MIVRNHNDRFTEVSKCPRGRNPPGGMFKDTDTEVQVRNFDASALERLAGIFNNREDIGKVNRTIP